MYCPKCGAVCGDDQRFCNNCGAPFETASVAEDSADDAPVAETPEIEPAEDLTAEDAVEAVEAVEETVDGEPVIEPAVFEQPPVVEEQPPFQPSAQQFAPPPPPFESGSLPPPPPPGCMPPPPFKKCGVGTWIGRIVISLLPLLVTYLALFVSGVIWPNTLLPTAKPDYMSSYAPEAKTIATVILVVIGVSALVQLVCLIVWALRKKGDPALRDWAVGFIIVAIAVAVVALLFSLGMMLFNDNYPRLFSFLEAYVAPVRYVGLLLSAL